MLYCFGDYEIDGGLFELRRNNVVQKIEPLVFDLILFLAKNAYRTVSRDEIVEAIWNGRAISDATISGCVKSARAALGDSGQSQIYIRTVRGRGFRFAAEVRAATPAIVSAQAVEARPDAGLNENPGGKPSIAVLPFQTLGQPGDFAELSDAIPYELILALGRLRWLFVIARGSSFHFRGSDPDIPAISQKLGVRYCLTGAVEVFGKSLAVNVELVEAATGALVWGDRLSGTMDNIQEIRGTIVTDVVTSLEIEIPRHEALRAQLSGTENLSAWQAYHLGLKWVHQYTRDGNAVAIAHFRHAIEQEPEFARAHAGLSFAHFQHAFMHYTTDFRGSVLKARRAAERSIELDPMDPFANFSMGRCDWIDGNPQASKPWLEQAIAINPNYAQGIYTQGLTDMLCGHTRTADRNADLAMALSPLDPLLYGMRGVRAMSHFQRDEFEEAATWAEAGASTPRAHAIMSLLAVACHAVNGDFERARERAVIARAQSADLSREHLFFALPFQDPHTKQRIARALQRYGF